MSDFIEDDPHNNHMHTSLHQGAAATTDSPAAAPAVTRILPFGLLPDGHRGGRQSGGVMPAAPVPDTTTPRIPLELIVTTFGEDAPTSPQDGADLPNAAPSPQEIAAACRIVARMLADDIDPGNTDEDRLRGFERFALTTLLAAVERLE